MQALQHRADGKLYRIQTPQTPIARTKRYNTYKMDEFPSGMNMIVAVLAYTGGQQALCRAVLPAVVWVAGSGSCMKQKLTDSSSILLEHSAAFLISSCLRNESNRISNISSGSSKSQMGLYCMQSCQSRPSAVMASHRRPSSELDHHLLSGARTVTALVPRP